jgi:hypothetical protein
VNIGAFFAVVDRMVRKGGIFALTFALLAASSAWSADLIAPTVPSNASLRIVNDTTAVIQWNSSTDDSGAIKQYQIYRNGAMIASTAQLYYVDSSLVANTLYSYSISAQDFAGNNSALSAAVSSKTTPALQTINVGDFVNIASRSQVVFSSVASPVPPNLSSLPMPSPAAWGCDIATIQAAPVVQSCRKFYFVKFNTSALDAPTAGWVAEENLAKIGPIAINSGNLFTSAATVSLSLQPTLANVQNVYISNTPDCGAGGTWKPFTGSLSSPTCNAPISWTLPNTEGVQYVSVKFKDSSNVESACSKSFIIRSRASLSQATDTQWIPQAVSLNPASPSRTTNIPKLKAYLDYQATNIAIHKNNTCSLQVASACKADIEAGNVSLTLASNATTNLFARVTDGTGRSSNCYPIANFTHDNIAPSVLDFSMSANSFASTLNVSVLSNVLGATQMAFTTTTQCGGTLVWKPYDILSAFDLPAIAGAQTLYAQFKDDAGNFSSCVSAQLVTGSAPQITFQSPPQMVAAEGSLVSLSVNASGSLLQYQWKKAGVAIAGATSPAFDILTTKLADAGAYTVTVSNNFGSVVSAPINLSVVSLPVVVTKPVAQTVNAGATATLSVSATGSGLLSYQWSQNGVDLPATSSAYTISNAQAENAGSYLVKITNTVNGNSASVWAGPVSLTVQAVAPTIQTQPQSASLPPNNSVSFQVVASGSKILSYQWKKNGVALSNGGKISGAQSAILTIADILSADGGNYSVTISNAAGTITSANALLTIVTPPITILDQPLTQTVLTDSTVSFSVRFTGTRTGYDWYKDGVKIIAGGRISFVDALRNTQMILTITGVQMSDAGSYRCVIGSASGPVPSNVALLTVRPQAPGALKYLSQDSSYFAGYAITPNVPKTLGGGPIDQYIVSPTLPAGLSLDKKSGRISGTPQGTQLATSYTVTASNASGSSSTTISIAVKASAIQNFKYQPSSVSIGANSPPIRMVPSLDGGDLTVRYVSAPSLPPGISLDVINGIISGSPIASWTTTNYSVSATNMAGNFLAPVSIFPIAVGGTPKLTVKYNLQLVGGNAGTPVTLAPSTNQQTFSVVLTNEGTAPLSLNAPRLQNAYVDGTVGFYLPDSFTTTTLLPGQATSVRIILGSTMAGPTNSGEGAQSNTLLIPSNDPAISSGVYQVPLNGNLKNSFDLTFQKNAVVVVPGTPISLGTIAPNAGVITLSIQVGTKQLCDATSCSTYTMNVSSEMNGTNSPFSVGLPSVSGPARFTISKGGIQTLNLKFNSAQLSAGTYRDLLVVGFTGAGSGSATSSSAESMYFFPLTAVVSAPQGSQQQAFSISLNGHALAPNMDIFLGTTPRGVPISQTIQLKNISGTTLQMVPDSTGRTVTSENPSEFPPSQLDQSSWANGEVRDLRVTFNGSSLVNTMRKGSLVLLYKDPTSPGSLGYFFVNLGGMSSAVTTSAGNISIEANGRAVANGQSSDVDLKSVMALATSPTTILKVTNTSANPVTLTQVAVTPATSGIQAANFLPVSINANGSSTITLQMLTSSSGIKEGKVTISYQVGGATSTFIFPASGVVWTSKNENLSQDRSCKSGGMNSCAAATTNYPIFGSEELALLKAKTDIQFKGLIPTLTLTDPEFKLKTILGTSDLGVRLYNLTIASNRFKISLGAAASLATWADQLFAARKTSSPAGTTDDTVRVSILSEIQNFMTSTIDNAVGDPLGTARIHLLLSISNVKQLNSFTRGYSAFLLNRGLDSIKNLNALGKYFMRAALAKIYLSTNPTLEDASKILIPVLSSVSDRVVRDPIARQIVSQYPELYFLLSEGVAP